MATGSVLAKMAVEISAQTVAFDKALKNSSAQLRQFQVTANTINKTLTAFGVGFGIYEVARGVKAAIGVMSEFESTMSEVRAITGATGKEFERLRDDALKLGSSTKFTATQVGQLQVAYGRLGFSTREILDATSATLDLAAATGEDLAKSADVAGSTVRGFGLNAKETQRVVDVMASSFNKTALGLENFTESMKYVAPVAAATGATVEETTALLGVLADAGIRGSMAGTSLRKIFTDLSKDGRPLSERLQELANKGITLQDSFDEVGRTAQTSLLILAKNTDKTRELASAFKLAGGEASAMARVMSDNLQGDVTKLSSAFEGLILKLSNSQVLRDFTKSVTGILNALQGVSDADPLFERIANAMAFNGGPILQETADDFVKVLGDIRQAAGKPFDTKIIEELANKYKLTSEAARQLTEIVLKSNEALSFQERAIKQFNDFAAIGGYKDLTKAAEDYKNTIYKRIIAEEILKQSLEESSKTDDDTFADGIKRASEQIAAYRRVIGIINEYAAGFTKAEGVVEQAQAPVIKNLKYYQDALKAVNEQYELVDAADTSRLRILAATAAGYEEVIKKLLKLKELGKDDTQVFKAPEGIKVTDEAKIQEGVLERVKANMLKFQQNYADTSKKIKEVSIEMSSAIVSSISTVADAFGALLVNQNFAQFGQSIIKAIASFARQLGEALIAIGIGMAAAKLALKNPFSAIAAGVALVALAGALNAASSKAQSNFNSGGSGAGTSSPTAINYGDIGQRIQFEVIPGELKISGQTAVALIKVQQKRDGRNKGG